MKKGAIEIIKKIHLIKQMEVKFLKKCILKLQNNQMYLNNFKNIKNNKLVNMWIIYNQLSSINYCLNQIFN